MCLQTIRRLWRNKLKMQDAAVEDGTIGRFYLPRLFPSQRAKVSRAIATAPPMAASTGIPPLSEDVLRNIASLGEAHGTEPAFAPTTSSVQQTTGMPSEAEDTNVSLFGPYSGFANLPNLSGAFEGLTALEVPEFSQNCDTVGTYCSFGSSANKFARHHHFAEKNILNEQSDLQTKR